MTWQMYRTSELCFLVAGLLHSWWHGRSLLQTQNYHIRYDSFRTRAQLSRLLLIVMDTSISGLKMPKHLSTHCHMGRDQHPIFWGNEHPSIYCIYTYYIYIIYIIYIIYYTYTVCIYMYTHYRSIYRLFWGSPGIRVSTHPHMYGTQVQELLATC